MSTMKMTCLACGHVASVAKTDDCDCLDCGIFRCDQCRARMSFGVLMPRVVVEPFIDARGRQWLRRKYQDPKTKADLYVIDVDPQYAAMEAKQILSLVIP